MRLAAGMALADTLEAENTALAALDLPRAAGMLADKQRAVTALAAVRSVPARSEAADRVARRLQALAVENKRLLERAIAVQGRVIGVIARAAAPEVPAGYGSGRITERPAPIALSARA
jgi:hypothetical protein